MKTHILNNEAEHAERLIGKGKLAYPETNW